MPTVPSTVPQTVNPESSVESAPTSASVPNPAPTATKPVSTPKKSNGALGAKTSTKPSGQFKEGANKTQPTTVSERITKAKTAVKAPPEAAKIGLGKATKVSVSTEAKPTNGKKAPVKAGTKAPVKTVAKPTPAKGKAPKARKERKTGDDSIRLQVFKMLNKAQDGLTEQEVREKLGYDWNMGPQGPILKAEGCCDNPRIKRAYVEGTRAAKFFLTARGKKAVEKGTVDSEKAEKSAGIDWPDKR